MTNQTKHALEFTPDVGTLFYTKSMRVIVRQVGEGDTAVAVKEADRSYENHILRCVAVDDSYVVADIEWSDYGTKRRTMLQRAEYAFSPVGPGVVEALGLEF